MIVNKNGNQYRNAYICWFPPADRDGSCARGRREGRYSARYCTVWSRVGINLPELCKHKELGIKVSPTSKGNQSTVLWVYANESWVHSLSGYSAQATNRLIDDAAQSTIENYGKNLPWLPRRYPCVVCNAYSIYVYIYTIYIYTCIQRFIVPTTANVKVKLPKPNKNNKPTEDGKVKSAQKADKVFIPHAAKNTLECQKCTLNQ